MMPGTDEINQTVLLTTLYEHDKIKMKKLDLMCNNLRDLNESQKTMQNDMISLIATLQDAANTVQEAANTVNVTAKSQRDDRERTDRWMQGLISKALQSEQRENKQAQVYQRQLNWKITCVVLTILCGILGVKIYIGGGI
jgi:hypothetical protein